MSFLWDGRKTRSSYSPFLRRNASRMFTDKFFVFVMGLFRLFPLNVKNKSWKDLRISLHAHHFLSFSGGREIRAYRDVIARWNDKLIAFSRVTSVNAERESSVGHGYVIERFELMPFHKPNKKSSSLCTYTRSSQKTDPFDVIEKKNSSLQVSRNV